MKKNLLGVRFNLTSWCDWRGAKKGANAVSKAPTIIGSDVEVYPQLSQHILVDSGIEFQNEL